MSKLRVALSIKCKESDVLEATQTLCKLNQTTTTLDVKNHLRKLGFYTLQSDISMLMDRLNSCGHTTWIESGSGYRIYSLVKPQVDVLGTSVSITPNSDDDSDDDSNDDSDDVNNITSKKTRKVKVGDWRCWIGNKSDNVKYISYINENLTRSQARWKFAKQVDINEYVDDNPIYINESGSHIRDVIYLNTHGVSIR